MATDYNDGKWHGWNGGECPLHLNSVVDCISDSGSRYERRAGSMVWYHDDRDGNIIAFRVIKPYRAPREWWAAYKDCSGVTYFFDTKEQAESHGWVVGENCFRAREVPDE